MSFPKYPIYKDSGVEWLGKVPERWEVKQLKRVLRLLTEKTARREHPVALENIESWSGRFLETETVFEGEGVAFRPGDILFGKLRPYLAKAYLAETCGEAVGDFHVMRPNEGINGRFAQYQILNRDFIALVDGSTFGSKMPRASWDFVGGVKIAIPSYEEQNLIVAFLDRETVKIDSLIAAQQRLFDLLQEKRHAVISQAVTKGLDPSAAMKSSGVEWLGDVPVHWETRTIAKASTKITNGYVGPTRDILVDAGVPYIQATHIKQGRINFDDSYFVTSAWSNAHAKSVLAVGDVLIVQTGAGTGDTGLVSSAEAGFNCHALIIVAPDKSILHGEFLLAILQSAYGHAKLSSIQTGAMHPHLNCGEVKFVEIPIPPPSEQDAIVSYLKKLAGQSEALICEAQRAIDLLQERRTALISAAVTGQIVNRRAILTRFGVKSASKIDHPIPCTALPAVRGELGCCAWKRLARFADGGWCRGSRSARSPGIWGSRAIRSNGRCARRGSGLSTGARASRGRS